MGPLTAGGRPGGGAVAAAARDAGGGLTERERGGKRDVPHFNDIIPPVICGQLSIDIIQNTAI